MRIIWFSRASIPTLALAVLSTGCEDRAIIRSANISEPVNICPGEEVTLSATIYNFRAFRVSQNGAIIDGIQLTSNPYDRSPPAIQIRMLSYNFHPVVDTTYRVDAFLAGGYSADTLRTRRPADEFDASFEAFRNVIDSDETRILDFRPDRSICQSSAVYQAIDLQIDDRRLPTNTWSDHVRISAVSIFPSPAFSSYLLVHNDRERSVNATFHGGEERRDFEGMFVPGQWTLITTLSPEAMTACKQAPPPCTTGYLCARDPSDYPPGYPPTHVAARVRLTCH